MSNIKDADDTAIKLGFSPIFDKNSRLLILGSFPSVKSREVAFFYANPLNRFWKVLSMAFEEALPSSTQSKIDFLLRNNVALWDIVAECKVTNSSDSTIKVAKAADIAWLLAQCDKINKVICNGKKSFQLLQKYYPTIANSAICLPSTSPANTSFDTDVWLSTLKQYTKTEQNG